MQMLFCIIILACAGHLISQLDGWLSLSSLNFAVFASVTGLPLSSLLLLGPMFNEVLDK